MGTVVATGTTILRCSVCGEDQKFTQEDYVKLPKGVYERCKEEIEHEDGLRRNILEG